VKRGIAKDFEQSSDLMQVLFRHLPRRILNTTKNISKDIRPADFSQHVPRGDEHACNITNTVTSFSRVTQS